MSWPPRPSALGCSSFQLQSDQGPCLDCYRTGQPVNVPDLRHQMERWPMFVPAALEQGYTAVHAVPLRLRGEVLGALNLFSTRTGALSPSSLSLARALADGASIAILYDQAAQRRDLVIEQLEGALTSRVVIEQAKGMLAATGDLSMDVAFARLRGYARRNQAHLTAVARDLAEGTIDPQSVLEVPGKPHDSAG
ncbi:GAF and ANTAR domain-containing protein [Leekyejoonella antrihumi]|uniref:GAF and ANTAR domain-containing protein n=1 Tax=Leekyejoonella antrihumi TaxID=1660198 RepID=UPI001C94B128|nr:GAF and ANTAR domain-containing protein [Leekyejoonella antrihumi]